MFLCLVMGIYSYNSLGRSEDPSFTIKQMVVSAAWPGATAKEVEEHLTDKIEKQLQTVPNIDRITSYSRPGTAVINVYLQDTVPVKRNQNSAGWNCVILSMMAKVTCPMVL